ncbi:hypothetical protein [Lysinibacillus capsici]|uniref:Ger(x)C family spore germination protein n=1 Tax=Lysinibacillus capsici TaxID=2115968 RepID=UPI003D73624D
MKLSNKKVIYLICSLLTMVLILSGCWDIKDINHRLLPVSIGVKKVDDQYLVILNIPEPIDGSMETKIVSAKAETVSKAVDTISRNMESDVYLLHVKLIFIEKETAEDGINDIIAGFMRSRDVSPKALVAICDEDLQEFFNNIKINAEKKGSALITISKKMQAGILTLPLQEFGRSSEAYILIHMMWLYL